jgi:nucleotide-binding universal stress UspA family protein
MLRSVLVALDGSCYSEPVTAFALDWATRFGADLLGLGIVDQPSIEAGEPVSFGGMAFKKRRDEIRLVDAHHRVHKFLAQFRARCEAAGVACGTLEEIGEPAGRILLDAQRTDVIVLGHETHFRFETQEGPHATLAVMLRQSPGPVVVVPRDLPEGGGIVVAYGGGREAAHTLQTFELLGLAAGEEIVVVTVRREGAEAEAIARLAGDFLTARGAPHRLHPIASDAAPAEVLLEEVRRHRPRLLVLGAHAFHPLRDLFATSVTRAVLRACPVPLFIGA